MASTDAGPREGEQSEKAEDDRGVGPLGSPRVGVRVRMRMAAAQVTHDVGEAKADQHPADDPRKHLAGQPVHIEAEPDHPGAQERGEEHVPARGQRRHAQQPRPAPASRAPGQHERQPVRRDRRVEKGDGETRERDGGQDGGIHAGDGGRRRAAQGATLSRSRRNGSSNQRPHRTKAVKARPLTLPVIARLFRRARRKSRGDPAQEVGHPTWIASSSRLRGAPRNDIPGGPTVTPRNRH